VKTIRIREEYYRLIVSGKKTCEVRVRLPMFDAISPGEIVRFACGRERTCARAVSVRRYHRLLPLVLRERAGSILPGAGKRDVCRTIRSIYPREKRAHGFIVIDFELTGPVIPPEG
jgi:ASC-1-like (ASCH) protein